MKEEIVGDVVQEHRLADKLRKLARLLDDIDDLPGSSPQRCKLDEDTFEDLKSQVDWAIQEATETYLHVMTTCDLG
jgi:hypothetical protein